MLSWLQVAELGLEPSPEGTLQPRSLRYPLYAVGSQMVRPG